MTGVPSVRAIGTVTQVQTLLTITPGAGIYVAGDNIGGLVPVFGARSAPGTPYKLMSLTVADHAHQNLPLDIVFFSAPPASSFVDGSPFPTLPTADVRLIQGRLSIVAGDWVTVGGAGIAQKSGTLMVLGQGQNASGLYLAINVTSGTPTFAAASDLTITTGFQND